MPIDADAGAYRLSSAAAAGSEPLEGRTSQQLDLFIDNVQAGSTTGDYVCLASNSEGSVEARAQVLLAVPAVIISVPKNQTRLEGERAELQCQARALPANITYKWLFNDKPLASLKWFEGRHTQRRDGSLVIHSLHRDDQGDYKCQATNGLTHRNRISGSSAPVEPGGGAKRLAEPPAPIFAEASAHLQVEYMARVVHSPPLQYLPLALSGQIRCFVQAAPPVEFFTWTLNNSQFDPNMDPNVEQLRNGSLLIKQVRKEYAGSYRCTPFNKHGTSGSSGPMEVRVELAPEFELRPADFYKATLNGQLKVPCEGRGQPRPSVSWRRVNRASRGTRAAETTTTAAAAAAGPPVADQQRLLLRNAISSEPSMRSLVVQQQHQHQSDDSDADDERLHFYQAGGEAAGQPEQQEQRSVIVYAKLPSERAEIRDSHLFLHNLRKEDHGRYECVVENEVATLVASTMLYIEGESPRPSLRGPLQLC